MSGMNDIDQDALAAEWGMALEEQAKGGGGGPGGGEGGAIPSPP